MKINASNRNYNETFFRLGQLHIILPPPNLILDPHALKGVPHARLIFIKEKWFAIGFHKAKNVLYFSMFLQETHIFLKKQMQNLCKTNRNHMQNLRKTSQNLCKTNQNLCKANQNLCKTNKNLCNTNQNLCKTH